MTPRDWLRVHIGVTDRTVFAYQQTNRDYVILTYQLCTDQVSLLEERESTIGKDSRANGGEATDTTNVISFT